MLLMRERVNQLELMDLGQFGAVEYKKTLEELELINRLTAGYTPTIRAIEALVASRPKVTPERPIRILDVGFGYGDTLRVVAVWAKKSGLSVECVGVDLNPEAKRLAESATPDDLNISFHTANAFEFDQGPFDIIINSLFMHHLSDEEILKFLKWMSENAKLGWFINDLHRHPVAYHFFKVFSRVLGFTGMICHDGPLSIARSFRRRDWQKYLSQAQVKGSAEIKWHWSFRYGVLFKRTSQQEVR